jgi:DNA-binding transcriptional regulator YhcF (GntR family)
MKTTKVINTYKDGILTSSKEVEVLPKKRTWDTVPQKPPAHPRALCLADSMQVSLNAVQKAYEALAAEARILRKKLLTAERAVKARTKEREALKRANQSKRDKIAYLEEKNEELGAKLFAASEDLKFLEEAQRLHTTKVDPAPKKRVSLLNRNRDRDVPSDTNNSNPKSESVRSIAAKPIKR